MPLRLDSVVPQARRFAHRAMATEFEVFIVHTDGPYAEQAAGAAFEALDQLERELSRYIENSDVSRINNLDGDAPLAIGLAAFECLQQCVRIHAETGGVFDVTVGGLVDCWRRSRLEGRAPSQEELTDARRRTGMNRLELDETRHTVRLRGGSVRVDLGGIGKGYAVDRMAAVLREWDIEQALINGGHSSVLALGAPPDFRGWPLTLDHPRETRRVLGRVQLRQRALGASGLRKGPHVIDPRTGRPLQGDRAAWCCTTTAVRADALSTAFLVMTPDEVGRYCARAADTRALLVVDEGPPDTVRERIWQFGPWTDVALTQQA